VLHLADCGDHFAPYADNGRERKRAPVAIRQPPQHGDFALRLNDCCTVAVLVSANVIDQSRTGHHKIVNLIVDPVDTLSQFSEWNVGISHGSLKNQVSQRHDETVRARAQAANAVCEWCAHLGTTTIAISSEIARRSARPARQQSI
jgi:hypothetical protein